MTLSPTVTTPALNRAAGLLIWGGIGLALAAFIAGLTYSEPSWVLFNLLPAAFGGVIVFDLGLILGLVAVYRGQAGQVLHTADPTMLGRLSP
ncbi:hypothetical protein E4U03_11845 [Rothia nasimurium]|uniref:Uncharacterized protein n=1 Tax=Rothia nasimurium TaxID=85336 RepID=A0A4Y9F1H6_9MICC|nr:hypothetical protein [Rothia nasimurium]MBF0809290.1 hypothetical protein [Rothia nasimurium]TFU20107.1 hypothetical protein E4U03_11845 [Rothia nasimurium]